MLLAPVALALTGCGAGLTAHPGVASTSSAPPVTHAAAPVVCWRLRKLVGVAHPTQAHINIGDISSHGGDTFIELGARYATRGCTKVIASALGELLGGIASDYYVVIDGAKHPFELTGVL